MTAVAGTVTGRRNLQASGRADNPVNRVDNNNQLIRAKAKERKAKARLHLRNN
jgi:hypothetical protein